MIAAAIALAAVTVPGSTVPVAAVIDSLRCDWRELAPAGAIAATGTLMLSLADGAVPVEGEATGRETRVVPFRLDATMDAALDCRAEPRLAAPVLPLAGMPEGGGARGWFVLARLADGRVTAVTVDPATLPAGIAQGFDLAIETEGVRGDGLRVKRAAAVRRKRCVGRPAEQVCY